MSSNAWTSGRRAARRASHVSGVPAHAGARVDGAALSETSGVVVKKYGGSSVATLDSMRRIATHVAQAHRSGGPVVVVVSARGDTTDELIDLATQAGGTRTARETDQLLATGECASAALMAMLVAEQGAPAISLTGQQAGIRATGKHGEGVIDAIDPERIVRLLHAGRTVVVAGFQGVNDDGDVITLGRGGSDTTAVALAAVLGAARCEIYTDVDGVYSADPRVVRSARVLSSVDVGLMAEMAFAGAKVLHSRAVELAAMYGIEVHVRNSVSHEGGTVISVGSQEMLESAGVVVGITHDTDVARVLAQSKGGRTDLAADMLAILARNSVPVDLVARSGQYEDEFRMGFTIRRSDVAEIRGPLEAYVKRLDGRVHIDENVGKISVVGMGLLNRPQYTARMLSLLSAAGIATSWIATSQLRTSVVVPLDRLFEAVDLLHHEFELDSDLQSADEDDAVEVGSMTA